MLHYDVHFYHKHSNDSHRTRIDNTSETNQSLKIPSWPSHLVCLVLCNEFLESIKSYITVFRVFSSNGLRSIKLCFIQTCRFVCNDSKPVGQSSSPCDDERKSMQQTISCQNTRQKIFPKHMTWYTIIVSSSCHIQIMSSSLAFINSSKK